jgi:hypothetical protein
MTKAEQARIVAWRRRILRHAEGEPLQAAHQSHPLCQNRKWGQTPRGLTPFSILAECGMAFEACSTHAAPEAHAWSRSDNPTLSVGHPLNLRRETHICLFRSVLTTRPKGRLAGRPGCRLRNRPRGREIWIRPGVVNP